MFKPILAGMFSAMSVNRKLRELHSRIDALESSLNLTATDCAETETVTIAEPEPEKAEETVTETVEAAFDWRTTDDATALKAWAIENHGLEIKGNKKADTIRTEIRGFLEVED